MHNDTQPCGDAIMCTNSSIVWSVVHTRAMFTVVRAQICELDQSFELEYSSSNNCSSSNIWARTIVRARIFGLEQLFELEYLSSNNWPSPYVRCMVPLVASLSHRCTRPTSLHSNRTTTQIRTIIHQSHRHRITLTAPFVHLGVLLHMSIYHTMVLRC